MSKVPACSHEVLHGIGGSFATAAILPSLAEAVFSLLWDMLIHLTVAWVQPKEPARVALVPVHGTAECLDPRAIACCEPLCSLLLAG